MLIRLTEQQMEKMACERLLDRVTGILAESYPDARPRLQAADTREEMRRLNEKAHAYGLDAELDLARYLIAAWILGLDFDTRYPAIAEILAQPAMTPAQKAGAIEQVTTTLMETLEQGARR